MLQPRLARSEVTPEYEDAGLFKKKVLQLSVELIPQVHRNSRQDIVVRGFTQGEREISVVFAGRRAKEAAPLEAHLKAMRSKAREMAKLRNLPMPDTENIRCNLQIEGAWRLRFERDYSGWETRSYQLMASRWVLMGEGGKALHFGIAPAI